MADKRKSRRGNGSGSLYRRKPGGPWIAEFADHTGRRRQRSTRTTDKRAAERILRQLVADVALRVEGVIDPRADALAEADRMDLSKHADDFKKDLQARGNTPQHVRETCVLVLKVAELGKINRVSQITPARVQQALKSIKDAGRSHATLNKSLTAIKAFSKWLVANHRLPSDAIAHVKAFNKHTDRRYERRALTVDELRRLIDAAERAQSKRGISGPDRAMAYRLAAGTGFRVGELRSLLPSSFNLDADPPTVTVEAGYSKRRREDVQPIRRDLAEALRSWLATQEPGERVLRLPKDSARMIRADLKRAGISAEDASGRIIDFHSLRATYITNLVRSGASVKAAQTLARHSTPTLTLNTYTFLQIADLADALDRMPTESGSPGSENSPSMKVSA